MRALLRMLPAALLIAVTTPGLASAGATAVLMNGDPANVGLNDPTPAAPVAGNTGTTVGQQRLIALQYAANIWAANLDSAVPIKMLVSFGPRQCNATGAVLASSGAWDAFANFGGFPGPVAPQTWHHSSLADKRAGADLSPGEPDLISIFNINLGAANCLAGSGWYYGLDANEPGNRQDLVAVALHEFAHGIGFSHFASSTTGALLVGLPNVYERHVLDNTNGLTWDLMTDVQRVASAINSRKVVWNGAEVTAGAPSVLSLGVPLLNVTSPLAIAGTYEVGTAQFGPPLTAAGLSGQIVLAADAANAAGPSTTDACTAITNAGAVAGKIALVDRGTCGFIVKVANVQAAGAIAMIVADNVAGGPPAGLGGVLAGVTIPSVRITLADGNTIKAQLGVGVQAQLGLDMLRRAGTDAAGRVLLNAPNPVVPGSSISHYDPIASRNLLMEPNINPDLQHALVPPADLTLALMHDIGWFPDADVDGFADDVDDCDASDLGDTIIVGEDDTGIPNLMFSNGCTMNDQLLAAAADAGNHGGFVSAVAHLGDFWRDVGAVTQDQRTTIQTAAAHSKVGK